MAQYYWSKYNAVANTSTTYSNNRLTASGSSSASLGSLYPFYSFSSSSGFTGSGSPYTLAIGDTGYAILGATTMIEYYITNKVGSTYYYNFWRYEADSSQSTTYSRGSLITTFIAGETAYVSGARNSDGYWYERGSVYVVPPPSTPTIELVMQNTFEPQTSLFIDWTNSTGADFYAVENLTTGQTHTLIQDSSHVWSGLNPGTTYQFRVSAHGEGGWSSYSNVMSGTTALPAVQRPTNWAWYTPKTADQPFNLTALEWTNFCAKINEFRTYRNYSNYSFSSVGSGSPFLASVFNEARSAIAIMNPSTSVPLVKAKGDEILAEDINRLRDSLNSIT